MHHGTVEQLQAECGFDSDGIISTIKSILNIPKNIQGLNEKLG